MRRVRSGQFLSGSRAAIAVRRSASLTAIVSSARAPMRWRASRGLVAPAVAEAKRNMRSSRFNSTSSSLDTSFSCAEYRSSIVARLVICAATADPAEVPTTTSALRKLVRRSGATSLIPRRTPSSHAIPATPPPARTRARRISALMFWGRIRFGRTTWTTRFYADCDERSAVGQSCYKTSSLRQASVGRICAPSHIRSSMYPYRRRQTRFRSGPPLGHAPVRDSLVSPSTR